MIKLTEPEAKANAMQIREKNCSICTNGLKIGSVSLSNSTHIIKEKYLCRMGLKFPACRWMKIGFEIKE